MTSDCSVLKRFFTNCDANGNVIRLRSAGDLERRGRARRRLPETAFNNMRRLSRGKADFTVVVTRARRTASVDWWITPGTAGMRPRDLFRTSRDYRESVGRLSDWRFVFAVEFSSVVEAQSVNTFGRFSNPFCASRDQHNHADETADVISSGFLYTLYTVGDVNAK
ncbi:hypothetical protein EVAR_46421_1 [Eumeta japonica]|uniref:Uncharacterized protein n=1 Tax=Eumeta variegata TaxID=151549 RepID=A0A4C1XEP4_EUMVA|nr:hypothetical protein EVAR_46421_1 [Eumeta japonica]